MKSASPRYRLTKNLVNYIKLKQLNLSYCAIGIYVCISTTKHKEFAVEELLEASTILKLDDLELAVEELLDAGLAELIPAAVMQGGAV